MIKRILTAIVVLPVSFIIIALLTLILVEICHGLVPGVQFSFSTVKWDPHVVPKAVKILLSTVTSFAHRSTEGISIEQEFAVVFALAGGLIFFLSCLSQHLSVMLLGSRRFFTVPFAFAYGFLVFGSLFTPVVNYIGGNIAMIASTPEQKSTAVAEYHTDYDTIIHPVIIGVAILAAIYLSIRLIRWDGLPWCREPLPPKKIHRSNRPI